MPQTFSRGLLVQTSDRARGMGEWARLAPETPFLGLRGCGPRRGWGLSAGDLDGFRNGGKGRTPAELSILVHEMVHHFQNVLGLKHECPQEPRSDADVGPIMPDYWRLS